MAKQFLDGAKVSTLLEHVRAERVAQGVRMHVGREPLRDGNLLDDAAHAAGGQPPATLVDQQGRRILAGFCQHRLPGWKIGCQRTFRGTSKRNVPFLLPFAANQDRFRAQPNVIEVDSDKLRVADAAAVETVRA